MKRQSLTAGFLFLFGLIVAAQETIPFDEQHWDLQQAKVQEHLGRTSLAGTAYLKNRQIENGIVEFDLAVSGQRSYPGVLFRMSSAEDYERIYVRPHLPPVFQNVVQYVSTFNGNDAWQLYSGQGYTASAEIPKNRWFHVKVEFNDSQARIFLDNSPAASLEIKYLGHGKRTGGLGLSGTADGTAFFSNFSIREDNSLVFTPPQPSVIPYGCLCDWEITSVRKAATVDLDLHPGKQGMNNLSWQKAGCRQDGIVDISRYYPRLGSSPDAIFARTFIEAEKDQDRTYSFGYSDIISVFLNGRLLFTGNSAYMSRDGNFQGIVGLNDYITLPLKKGKNELLITIVESFGGWGFIFRDIRDIYKDKSLSRKWELKNSLRYPESVQYDPKRDVLYVSNTYNDGKEFISKISTDGKILSMEWVSGILQPTGLELCNDKLYAVGRYALIEIDPDKGSITNRFRFPEPGIPNDVAADDKGNLYITDSRNNLLYRLSGGTMEVWMKDPAFMRPNGILFHEGKLIVGTSGDGCIRSVDPNTKAITVIACLGEGSIIDGIASDGKGNLLVSDYNGRLFRVGPKGETQLLLNTTAATRPCAAFEYIPSKKLLVIPTLDDNRVEAYELK